MDSNNVVSQTDGIEQSMATDDSASWQWPSLSTLLRFAGALFVAGSGITYLLQGLVDANMSMRYWAYLALMLVLTTGGLFSHKYMHDDKGSRLFFGLATLLVPIQFTQLGAMIFDWLNSGADTELILSVSQLAWFGGLSLVLGSLAIFSGLSILARPYAAKLTVYFLLLNAMLLLPERSLLPAMLLASGMAAVYLLLDRTVFNRDHRFQLLEGIAVKTMLVLPPMIVAARAGFHISSDLGIGLMVLQAALLFQSYIPTSAVSSRVAKVSGFAGYILFAIGWMMVAEDMFLGYWAVLNVDNDIAYLLLALPLMLMAAKLDQKYTDCNIYRITGGIVFGLYGLVTWASSDMVALVLLSVLAVAIFTYAMKHQSKVLLIVSTVYFVISLVKILMLSIGHIDINAWISMAIAGVILVAASSITERYGHLAKSKLANSASSLKEWDY